MDGLLLGGSLQAGRFAWDFMEAIKGSTNLILVGIWNPAILNPEWLVRHAFKDKEAKDVPVTIEIATFPGLSPRLTIEGIVFQPGRSRVVMVVPNNAGEEDINKVEAIATAILRELPHTPMQAVGQNFEFVENDPTPEQMNIFDSSDDLSEKCDFEFNPISQQVVSSIQFDGRTLNFTRTVLDGKLRLKFNFHYNVTSAEDAVDKISTNHRFVENYRYALRIINSLYGVDLAPQQQEAAHA